jgi:gliding motility-associated-like protein
MRSYYFLIALFSLCTLGGQAQSFTKTYSSGDLFLQYINITPAQAGWYAAGVYRSPTELGSFLTKFEEDGSQQWSKQFQYGREPRALVTLNDGSVLFFNNNSGFQGYFDASVVRMLPNGTFDNETVWGAPEDQDDWSSATKLPNGEVIAVGYSRESSSFTSRVMLVKFSATGQILWERLYEAGILAGGLGDVIPLPDGGFYVIGQYFALTDALSILAKFDADGNCQWIKSYKYDNEGIYFKAGQRLANGDLFIAAYQVANNTGQFARLTMLVLDAEGNVKKQKSLKNDYDLAPYALTAIAPDTLAIAAVTNGQVFPVVDNDNVVLLVNPDGDLLSHLSFGGPGQDLAADGYFSQRQVYICGMTDTSADGSARRAYLSKSGVTASCCSKNAQITNVPNAALPNVSNIGFVAATVPGRQNITITLQNFPLSETTTCQNADGIALLPADTSICVGDTLVLGLLPAVPAAGNVLWSTGAVSPTLLVDQPGIYTVQWSGECGAFSDTIRVVSKGDRITVTTNTPVWACPGATTALTATGGDTYRWLDDTGALAGTGTNLSVLADADATYTVIAGKGLCFDTASVALGLLDAPAVSINTPINKINAGASTVLTASGGAVYQWFPPDGLSCTDCPAPLATPATTTAYTVLVTTAEGCSDTATIVIEVKSPCPYYFPNVFTPEQGSEAGNDRFGVFATDVSSDGFLMQVYGRWGELVFETRNPAATWDGNYRDKPAPPGVYLYAVQMNTCDGPIRTNGNLTLIR